MAKSHRSMNKRIKELARKEKQEQKRQRKLEKDSITTGQALEKSQQEVNNSLT